MSYFGRLEDAKREARQVAIMIDGEDWTSPVRDGGTLDVGGAPIATTIGGGPTEFTQTRTRTGIMDHPVGTVVRQYGQRNKTNYNGAGSPVRAYGQGGRHGPGTISNT